MVGSLDIKLTLWLFFCTFSMFSITPFLQGHHTEFAYSKCGLTIALYNKIKVFLSTYIKFLLITPRMLRYNKLRQIIDDVSLSSIFLSKKYRYYINFLKSDIDPSLSHSSSSCFFVDCWSKSLFTLMELRCLQLLRDQYIRFLKYNNISSSFRSYSSNYLDQ